MRKEFGLLVAGAIVGVMVIATPDPASALPLSLSQGAPIVAIDGDGDLDVMVTLVSTGGAASYEYGYFLNGSSTFTLLSPVLDVRAFQGGDDIDFALRNGTTVYSLSGDSLNDAYDVSMVFGNQVAVGAPQAPEGWTAPYYYNVNMTWTIHPANILNTNEAAINFSIGGNDGVAPVSVPEPSSLLLLGAGLIGLGLLGRKKARSADRV